MPRAHIASWHGKDGVGCQMPLLAKLPDLTDEEKLLSRLRAGTLVKARLEKLEMEQQELSTAVGLTQPQISRFVNGKQIPQVETLIAIARVLGLRPGLIVDVLADYEAVDDIENLIVVPDSLSSEQKLFVQGQLQDWVSFFEKQNRKSVGRIEVGEGEKVTTNESIENLKQAEQDAHARALGRLRQMKQEYEELKQQLGITDQELNAIDPVQEELHNHKNGS